MGRIFLIASACLFIGARLNAGQVGSTLGKYSVAGAGVGALLGSAAATVPYLQSKQPHDFFVGAGVGMLSGAVVGYILGVIDLAGAKSAVQTEARSMEGLKVAWSDRQFSFAWNTTF
jgi:hypothetical protein